VSAVVFKQITPFMLISEFNPPEKLRKVPLLKLLRKIDIDFMLISIFKRLIKILDTNVLSLFWFIKIVFN
jgi:hypothetical protein